MMKAFATELMDSLHPDGKIHYRKARFPALMVQPVSGESPKGIPQMKMKLNWKPVLAKFCRWSARFTAPIAILLIFVYLFLGTGYTLQMQEPKAILVHALPLLAVTVGLLLSYWKELTGALLAFGGFLAIYAATGYFVSLEEMLKGIPAWLFLLVPIVLFFLSGVIRNRLPKG
jgi:hypothetical protein